MPSTKTEAPARPVARQASNLPQAVPAGMLPGRNPDEIRAAILTLLSGSKTPLCDGDMYANVALPSHRTEPFRWVREAMVKEGVIRRTKKVMIVNGKASMKKFWEVTPDGLRPKVLAEREYLNGHMVELLSRNERLHEALRANRKRLLVLESWLRSDNRRRAIMKAAKSDRRRTRRTRTYA